MIEIAIESTCRYLQYKKAVNCSPASRLLTNPLALESCSRILSSSNKVCLFYDSSMYTHAKNLCSKSTMKLQAITTLLLLPFATIVAGADGDPSPPGDRPSNGDKCRACEKQNVCEHCVTTKVPFTSVALPVTNSWVETRILCTQAATTSACTTPALS